MFLSVLAVTAILSAPAAPYAPPAEAPAAAVSSNAVIIDCQVAGRSLTDCKVIDGETIAPARSATALKLAADIQVPASMADANPGRIRIKLNVNP
jgi:hypothetical protein